MADLRAVLEAQAAVLERTGRDAMAQAATLRALAARVSEPAPAPARIEPAPAGPRPRLLRVSEVCEALNIKPTTLRKWCREGIVPRPHLLGGSTRNPRWPSTEIEALQRRRAAAA